jgi:hypothetical protein
METLTFSVQTLFYLQKLSFCHIFFKLVYIQSDRKEKKSEQALQIIGHVVADSIQISVHCMGVDNLWSQTPLHNKSCLMNFRHWNYNCAFYDYYLIMEKMYKINKSNILHS